MQVGHFLLDDTLAYIAYKSISIWTNEASYA